MFPILETFLLEKQKKGLKEADHSRRNQSRVYGFECREAVQK